MAQFKLTIHKCFAPMAPPHSYMLLPNNNANHLHPQICFTHRFGQNHTYTVWYGLCWQEESKFCTIMCNVCKSWSTLLVRLLTPICSVLLSTDCTDFIRRLLKPNPTTRLSLEGVLTHPWFLKKLPPHAQVCVCVSWRATACVKGCGSCARHAYGACLCI